MDWSKLIGDGIIILLAKEILKGKDRELFEKFLKKENSLEEVISKFSKERERREKISQALKALSEKAAYTIKIKDKIIKRRIPAHQIGALLKRSKNSNI